MKILIADDEVIIRTGLSRVIKWEELGLTLLEPAASAEEALERIDAEKPDILLTDIRMSGMTGLELAEEARKRLPLLEVIILTGYDDFVYTQQAIRQNVSDYLLKTSKPEEIIRTVLKAKQRAEEKRHSLSREYQIRQEERNRKLMDWIVRGDPLAAQADWLPESPGGKWQVLIVEPDGWGQSARELSLLQFAVNNALREVLTPVSFVADHRIVAIVPALAGEQAQALRSKTLVQLERLLKCNLVAAGGTHTARPEELHQSYETALEALSYKVLMKTNVWEYADIRSRKGGKAVCTDEEERELCAILLDDDPLALQRWVQRYISALLADEEATPHTLEASLQSVVLAAHRWLDRVLSAIGKKTAGEPAIAPIRFHEDLILQDGLFKHLLDVMKCYRNLSADGKVSHVMKAIVYIEEHVGKETGLAQVAAHVHLHPNHLSDLFKKETGMKFVDFVTQTKMQKAMELLATSPAKINEVAGLVGYDDVKYFSQTFKKFTGMTPSQYREQQVARSE